MGISHVYTYSPSFLSLPSIPSHPTALSHHRAQAELPLFHSSSPLAILHVVMYIFQCCCLHVAQLLLPPLCPQVFSLHLCLYSCPTNRFISTTFIITNKHILLIFAFVFLIDFTQCNRLSVHPPWFS